MRIPRIYTPLALASGARLVLDGDAANHLARVLRLRQGAPLVLFNGTGGEHKASIAAVGKREVEIDVGAFCARDVESPLEITLVQAVSRGERMDYTLQKAVELGVRRIVPVMSARSVVNLDDERRTRRLEHWRKVTIAACEQCGRNRLPDLLEPQPLSDWLLKKPEGLGLILDPRTGVATGDLTNVGRVSLLVGPEGGLSEDEIQTAERAGYRGLRLGPRVLRTETAALVAIAALQSRWGDLG